jgi:hypothetical protein
VANERETIAIGQLERHTRQGRNTDVAVLQILLIDKSTRRALEQGASQAALHAVNRKVQSYILSQDCGHVQIQNAILLR